MTHGLWQCLAVAIILAGSGPVADAQTVHCPADSDHPGGIGSVLSVFRDVEVAGASRDGWVKLAAGAIICRSDRIRTGERGRVRIQFNDGGESPESGLSILNVGDNTEVRIDLFATPGEVGEDAGFIEVIKGTIRKFMKSFSGQSDFHAINGTAVCGIRGTTFYMTVAPATNEARTIVDNGIVECWRRDDPGDAVTLGARQQVTSGPDGFGAIGTVTEDDLAALADRVDTGDGWTPPPPPLSPAAITGYPLPDAATLPRQCRAEVQAAPDVPRARYKYCDPDASVVYSACALTTCITPAQRDKLKSDRPQLVFERLDRPCQPGCDTAAGFSRLGFYRHGTFCGRCPDGMSWKRTHGCCN